MLTCYPYKALKESVVVCSIPLKAKPSQSVYRGLYNRCGGRYKDGKPPGAELSIILYCIYRMANAKTTNPGDALKTKMVELSAEIHDNNFIMTCKSSMTSAAIGNAFKAIAAGLSGSSRTAAAYKTICQALEMKFDADAFMWALGVIVSGIGSVSFAVVGPDIPADKQRAISAKVQGILDKTPKPAGTYKAPTDNRVAEPAHPVEIKTSRLGTLLIHGYLQAEAVDSFIEGHHVVPLVGEKVWPTRKARLAEKDRAARYSKAKFSHENTPAAMLVLAARSGAFTPADLAGLPKSYNPDTIASALVAAFK